MLTTELPLRLLYYTRMEIVLTKKEICARDTLLLTFKAKDSTVKLEDIYLPGDFIYLPLKEVKSDPRGEVRQFSLCSCPSDNFLQIVTRIRSMSNYKQALAKLALGTKIDIDPPIGTLHLKDNNIGPYIFIAGGVGIAPFMSRIRYLAVKKLNFRVELIYSNHLEEDVCFKKELQELESKHPWLTVNHVLTGIVGRLNKQKMAKFVSQYKNISTTKYWITGSPAFVDSLEKILGQLNISEEKIITEKFTGY